MRSCSSFVFLMALALTACNGSGSSSTTAPAPAPESITVDWGSDAILQPDSLNSNSGIQMASSADGTTIAIWEFNEYVSSNGSSQIYKLGRIHTSIYTPGSGWSTPVDLGDGSTPRLATNASGQGVAIWRDHRFSIMYSNYSPSIGWGTPTVAVINNTLVQGSPSVALDAEGNAVALWVEGDLSGEDIEGIYVSRYTNTDGWSAPAALYEGNGYIFGTGLAMNVNGEAMVIWGQYNSIDYEYPIRVNRFTPSGGWETAKDIGVGSGPEVVLDEAGNAMALWEKYKDSGSSIQASRFSASNLEWSTAAAIQTDASHYNSGVVAGVDAVGNVMVLWTYQGVSRWEIRGNRFRPDYGWEDSDFTLDANDTGNSYDPSLAIAPNGSALAGWRNFDGTLNYLRISRYLPDTGWSMPLTINTNSSGYHSNYVTIALDAKFEGTLSWSSCEGISCSRLTNRYELHQ